MEVAVPVVIGLIVLVVILIRRKEHLEEVHSHVSKINEERQQWDEQKIVSPEDVEQVVSALTIDIENKFADADEKQLLLDIVNEWAKLKVTSFENKRSWVRNPDSQQAVT